MTFEGLQIQGAIKIMEKLTVSKCKVRLSSSSIDDNIAVAPVWINDTR